MKKALFLCALSTLLCSCSLLQRHPEEGLEESVERPSAPPVDEEVAKLNAKVSALETKLEVLTATMERFQLRGAQPVIEAASMPQPQPNMAAPVEISEPQVSAAPVRPQELPETAKRSYSPTQHSETEREFREGMTLFQSGKNMEAASKFALLAKKHPDHLLAAHALYWAGEASAREQQWSLAITNWEELEKKYPRSAYLPESLAGLSRAYERQGDMGKARAYKDTLLRAFPKSPVAVHSLGGESVRKAAISSEEIPEYEASPSAAEEE